ncbi:MAG TPA: OmpA family protein [Flavobacteriaceae bacterium]|nr:OmpA family protein [Flavobacteriaceae bacterium]MCB9212673.1 OmpA family protein [Alteromonas sp.]HPF11812.1 OmpA family protein [Flavobacteriaceae bacterium]HQU20838.1 OmpA family protein [Flavobacteriaceae bacterium]HQU65013.1 OmpA family protein [Flavobacteriaceae bacterium]
MTLKIFAALCASVLLTSCVSSKIYEDLKAENEALKSENESLMAQWDTVKGSNTLGLEKLQKELEDVISEKTALAMELAATKNNYDRLKTSYDALEANSSSALTENLSRNRDLLKQLEDKEKALAAEANRLSALQKQLNARSKRVEELELLIATKDAQMDALKNAISAALTNFEGKGLTVEQRNGKVYVSMENKLLFESGSWAVNARGREAVVALGRVLAQNPDIAVLIEGHTDNVPYGGSGNLTDNWDLSTKRATAIVHILLENGTIEKTNLTAAGRGEFAPIASNETVEGRAKNRRIEVILTPKLDVLSQLLEK